MAGRHRGAAAGTDVQRGAPGLPAIGAALQIGRIPAAPQRRHSLVVVPVGTMSKLVTEGISAALSLGNEVVAITVCYDDAEDHAKDQRLRDQWERWNPGVPLVTLHSKKRSLGAPIVEYLQDLEKAGDQDELVVLIPEVLAAHPWQAVLHNQRGLRARAGDPARHPERRHLPAALRPVGGRRARGGGSGRHGSGGHGSGGGAGPAAPGPELPRLDPPPGQRPPAPGWQQRQGTKSRWPCWTSPSSCCWRSRRSPACARNSGSPPAARPTHPATRSGCRAWPSPGWSSRTSCLRPRRCRPRN